MALTCSGLPALAQAPLSAQEARLVSVVPTDGAAPTLVGESGELYEPSGELQWRRRHAGGVSVTVAAVYRSVQGVLYAVGQRAPLFRLEKGAWSMYPLVQRGKARASSGDLGIFAVHRTIYELGQGGFRKIATAKGTVSALWASSAKRLYVVTDEQSLWSGNSSSWRPIRLPLDKGEAITDVVGVTGHDAIALTTSHRLFKVDGKNARQISMGEELQGLTVHALADVHGRLLLAGVLGSGAEQSSVLAEVSKGAVQKIAELWPLKEDDRFALLASTPDLGILVATRRGQLQVLGKDGTWRPGQLHTDPPKGPTPADGRAPAPAH